jgi:hypothetical protein
LDIKTTICRFAYQYRWRQVIPQDDQTDLPKYPKQTVIHYPPSNDDIDNKLSRINNKIDDVLRYAQQQRHTSNLSRHEEQTLLNLKQKPLICLPSDKGGEFCVIERFREMEN